MRHKVNPGWQELVGEDADDGIEADGEEDLQVLDEYEEFDPGVLLPLDLKT
ncbi:hypothetical protein DVH05_015795 [Phytophthora capsici]|nr:hypothetical protein DVH05_015795 [Phytophthora capsici]